MLRADDTLHFYTSPYRRTRETTEGILTTLTSDDPSPSPFVRHKIKVYEEPRLREQDFGNFQPCSAEMERMWQERADYGHFFYRIPNGESAADAYDRISGFNESLWRQFGEDDFASVCVLGWFFASHSITYVQGDTDLLLVTHGLMSRVFLMKWYHFSVEYFEDLRNVNHCEFLIMRKQPDSGKYILESQLRTWSDLKRERLAALKEKEKSTGKEKGKDDKDNEKLLQAGLSTTPFRKRWGGCPDGCDHSKFYHKKEALSRAAQGNGRASPSASPINGSGEDLPFRRPTTRRWQSSDEEDVEDPRGRDTVPAALDLTKSRDEVVSSPDGTPSFISVEDRLRQHIKSPTNNSGLLSVKQVGRDFGGTTSGNTSYAGSDTEFSAEEDARKRLARGRSLKIQSLAGKLHHLPNGNGHTHSHGRGHGRTDSHSSDGDNENGPPSGRKFSGMGHGTKADALGDRDDGDSHEDNLDYEDHAEEPDNEPELDDLVKEQEEGQSIRGSVY